jgi:hypothetical protein
MILGDAVAIRHTNGSRRLVLAELNDNGLAIVPQAGVRAPYLYGAFMLLHVNSGRPLDNTVCQQLPLHLAISRWEQILGYAQELGVDLTLSPAALDHDTLRNILVSVD